MRFLHAASLVIFANAYTAVISSDQDPLRPSAKTKTNQQLSAVKNSADWAQLKRVEHWPVSSTSDQPVSCGLSVRRTSPVARGFRGFPGKNYVTVLAPQVQVAQHIGGDEISQWEIDSIIQHAIANMMNQGLAGRPCGCVK
jgi:hypothetical protein